MRFSGIIFLVMALGFSACHTPLATTPQAASAPELTLADAIPASAVTPEQQAAQEKLLQQDTLRFRSRELAGAYYVLEAQRTLKAEQTDSAYFFLERAYLTDSTNPDLYRTYGLLYGQQQQYDKALLVLGHALQLQPDNPLLLNDLATSHLSRFYLHTTPTDLLQSRKLLERATQLAPDEADAYYKLAITCYYLRDYTDAWVYLHKSVERDKNIADAAFIEALADKQPDPQGLISPQLGQ